VGCLPAWPSRFSLRLCLLKNTPRGASLDLTIGLGKGWGGEYLARTQLAAELTAVLPHDASGFVGLALGAQPTLPQGHALICHFDSSGTRCLGELPGTYHLGVFGGLERANKSGDALRVMVGPAYFGRGGGDDGSFGALARIDGAAGFGHVALIAALQGALGVHPEETLRLGTLLFGIRIQ
jgi:hypothetical protein